MRIHRRTLLALSPLALLATACTEDPDPAPTPSLQPPEANTPTGEELDAEDDAEGVEQTADAAPSTDDTIAVKDHARTTLEAFWDTDQPQEQWHQGLAQTMTPAGSAPFAYTLVENIQPGTITEEITLEWRTPTSVAAAVPTDQGTFTLILLREDQSWLTDSITFPKEG